MRVLMKRTLTDIAYPRGPRYKGEIVDAPDDDAQRWIDEGFAEEFTGGGDQGPPGEGVPTGGDTGQVLVKASSDDFDTEWATSSGAGAPVVSASDPGAVGAGIFWVDTSGEPPVVRVRNTTDDGWDSVVTPGAVRLVELGVVNAADLIAGEPTTLYTPAAGELVGPVILRDVTVCDTLAVLIGREEMSVDPQLPALAAWDTDTAWDGMFGGGIPAEGDLRISPTTWGPVTAVLNPSPSLDPLIYEGPWQAAHGYDGSEGTVYILGSDGRFWFTGDTGTSGVVEPDFAGNEDDTVLDNDITWTDSGPLPASGSGHVYAFVSSPVSGSGTAFIDFPGPAADPGDIADPPSATAENVAAKVNAILAALEAAGLMTEA